MKNKKKLVILSGVILTVLITGGAIYLNNKDNEELISEETDTSINYKPSTPAEKDQADANKDDIIKKQESQDTTSNPGPGELKAVVPVITNATSSQVNAYINGIYEDDGDCEAIFSNGSTELKKSTKGFKNVSYTQCAPIQLEDGFLAGGNWTVAVKYSSITASGISEKQAVKQL